MDNREEKAIRFINKFENVKKQLSKKHNKEFDSEFLVSLLEHALDEDDPVKFLVNHENLEEFDLIKILENELCSHKLEIDASDILENSIFSVFDPIIKAKIKNNGLIFMIHKGDEDPFPSDPHAHLVNTSLKLHLGSGDFFQKKKFVERMRKKEFLKLRDKIEEKGIILPVLHI